MQFETESAFQNYNRLTTLPHTQLGAEQLQGMGIDQPSDLRPRRKPGRWKGSISSTLEVPKIINSCITFTHLCFECVAFADGEMEERVSLSGAGVHHCHQLVDTFPGNEGVKGIILKVREVNERSVGTVQYLRGSSVTGSLANWVTSSNRWERILKT